jgi:ATP-dependent DNA helicase RecG
MSQVQKEAVLYQFREGGLDILVSTSVIEVGVDIPNASCMVVEGAEYFGLAQLHQLRGRVGRSTNPGYCFLFASIWNEHTSRRLELLVHHTDGFTLAEKDLGIRGPGDLYGTLQAGITPFRFASLSNSGLVKQASEISEAILHVPESEWSPSLRQWIEDRSSTIRRE